MRDPAVKTPSIIITGGAGLVGQNLLARMSPTLRARVVVLDKHPSNLAILRRLHPEVVAESADLASEGPWERHFEGAGAVIQLHAQIGAKTAEPFVRNNVEATRRVLDAMRRASVPYLVHVSSSVVAASADDPYTYTKREQERLVVESGIPSIVLRPTLMFGWFDRKHLGWLSRFMRRVPVFPIPGDGQVIRQPLFARDFSDIILRCLERRTTSAPLNISGVERIPYVAMIRAIRTAVRARCLIVHIPIDFFDVLLRTWARFDPNPPFTSSQLRALVAGDEFEVIDWPSMFDVTPTPFADAVVQTFRDPTYSSVVLDF